MDKKTFIKNIVTRHCFLDTTSEDKNFLEKSVDILVFAIGDNETFEDAERVYYEFELNGYDCRISNFSLFSNKPLVESDKSAWCYYVSIPLNEIGQFTSKGIEANYHESEMFNCVSWHGEMTFCNIEDENLVSGCDYQHHFDEDNTYSVELILEDVFQTTLDIDRYYPNIKLKRVAKEEKKIILEEINKGKDMSGSSYKI